MTEAKFVDSSEELAAALKQQAEHNTKVEALLKLTRDQDLAAAKRVIKQHGFTAKDLAPELKSSRRVSRTSPTRKTTARRKTK
jgi:antitoxin component HigA of HigAB toxin-antitoxin module